MPVAEKLVRKLEMRARLDDRDRAAIAALPVQRRTYTPPAYLLREGEPSRRYCSFIMSGLAFRQKLTIMGARQIVSLHMPGDFLDLGLIFLPHADYSVQALTPLDVVEIDRLVLAKLARERSNIARAMWIDSLIEGAMLREWVVNVGRRDARSRLAHLFCEFAVRLEASGAAPEDGFEFPMTQEQLGDAAGLTSIHVNRTLKALAVEGLIEKDRRHVRFKNWQALGKVMEFNPDYLHIDRIRGD